MKYRIDYTKDAVRTLKKWKKSNPNSFKKLYDLLPELEEHPRTGTGHPEPLKGGRRIDKRVKEGKMLKFDSVEELRKHLASL